METMFLQNFGGQTKSIMVFLKVVYGGLVFLHLNNNYSFFCVVKNSSFVLLGFLTVLCFCFTLAGLRASKIIEKFNREGMILSKCLWSYLFIKLIASR